MTRVLKRPMFRLGGNTDQGIMSGVAPRQGYYRGKTVGDLGSMTIGELEDMARASTRGDKRADLRDFAIDWGLGMVGSPPTGNILSTAANVARAPYERFIGRKAERKATESDMFSTLFSGAAEAAGEAAGGKGWQKQWEFGQIPILHTKIAGLEERIASGELTEEELKKAQLDLIAAEDQLDEIVELDEVTQNWLKSDEGDRFIQGIREELYEADPDKYNNNEESPQLGLDALTAAIRRLKKRRRTTQATGGRVGYQAAGPVMGDAVQADQAMPEELGDISYEELRARLPQEVGDEIVRLLANSAEALEDFATIQTEQDIANFNKKYGVNLVLPAEG